MGTWSGNPETERRIDRVLLLLGAVAALAAIATCCLTFYMSFDQDNGADSQTPILGPTSVSTAGITPTPRPSATVQPTATVEIVIDVDARVSWRSTGLTVEPDIPVTIEVIDGQWTVGVEEISYTGGEGGNFACADVAVPSTCPEPLPQAPIGALLGRIGDTVFLVGDGETFEPSDTGELELGINDNPETFYDNDGVLTVRITTGALDEPSNDLPQ